MKHTKPMKWAFGGLLALALAASGAGVASAQMLNPDGSEAVPGSYRSFGNSQSQSNANSQAQAQASFTTPGASGTTGSSGTTTPGSASATTGMTAGAATGLSQASAMPMTMTFASADLGSGSTGASVSELQGYLSELGFLTMPAGTARGYYGPMTASALARFQRSVGVPATGYFGPLTRAALAAQLHASGWMGASATSTSSGTSTDPSGAVTRGSWWYNPVDNTWNHTITDVMASSSANGGLNASFNGQGSSGSVPSRVIDTTVAGDDGDSDRESE